MNDHILNDGDITKSKLNDMLADGQLLPIGWHEPIYIDMCIPYNCIVERDILYMSRTIRKSPTWMSDIENLDLCQHWAIVAEHRGMTGPELDYVFKELYFYKSLHDPASNVRLGPVDMVWFSDHAVSKPLADVFKKCASGLEKSEDSGQLRNLIDPFMYPFVYGKTPILNQPIQSTIESTKLSTFGAVPKLMLANSWMQPYEWPQLGTTTLPEDAKRYLYLVPDLPDELNRFSWLPAEFRVDSSGNTTIESYINNLHPAHDAGMYNVIAQLFSELLPMLEQVLTDTLHVCETRTESTSGLLHEYYMNQCSGQVATQPVDEADSDPGLPEVRVYPHSAVSIRPRPDIDSIRPAYPYSLRDKRLQAVVQMYTIELTPEDPEYPGDKWHVQGFNHEMIVATGMYFYDVENIDGISMAFREPIVVSMYEDLPTFPMFRKDGMPITSGSIEEEHTWYAIHEIGSIDVSQGRCFVYPNAYQQRTMPFRLKDSTRPGHCKCIAFHYVDPKVRTLSTEIVPPQQQSWWVKASFQTPFLARMPDVVRRRILQYTAFPISETRAKRIHNDMHAAHEMHNKILSKNKYAIDMMRLQEEYFSN